MDTTGILIKVRKIVRAINLESKKIQKEYGVSIPQVLCLSFLHQAPDYQSTQGEIRKFLNLNSSTASGIIHRLEKKGYLARLPRSGDKRVVKIVLTSDGQELLMKVPSLLHEQLSEKLQQLNEEKIQEILRGLDALVTILNLQEMEASPLLTVEDYLNNTENE